jgi:hypothetical protein
VKRADGKRERSRRGELQNLLGDLGTVLPRQPQGTLDRRAQGWYAELVDEKTVFLGDTAWIAAAYIRQLSLEHAAVA